MELLAATYAIKAFTKSLSNVHVLIQMDNTSAIAYVNKMGGAKQGVLAKHARSLWEWCLARKITLRAEHIPGRLNVIADVESRAKPDAAGWKLDAFTVDLFANRNNTQLERFYSYLPDPLAEQYNALVQPWREECLCLPPFQLDQQMSEEDKPRRSNFVDHMPSVPSAGMVLPPTTVANRQSSFASSLQQPGVRPTGEQTSNDCQQLPASSSSEGISKEATDILLSAQRSSTNAQYKSCWAKWCRWSRQRQIDPFCPAVSDLVHFLTELFEQGKQYSTITTYRSAISSTVPPLDGSPLGQHKIVCSFMRGVFNNRPPKPHYSGTWEVSLVTNLFEKWPDNSNLDIKRLSRKCAMLLALSSAK